ncbi:MAG: type IV secretion system DNA-binding domain-containing protein [Oscillospiraceae bacterium]|nr:type IV secretion system DNA-binding domain-containing protein [Oscillospiraceae bacterium]
MRCAWKELLSILPAWMRSEVDRQGRDTLQELRLRLGLPPELICSCSNMHMGQAVTGNDLNYIINTASRYSPWAASSIGQGYLTAPGGHRIGICGEAVVDDHGMTGIRQVRSLCIRVARDFPGLADKLRHQDGSILILGAPGNGKTTLLRDLIRQRSEKGSVAVVDERGELFPAGFSIGERTDVMTGCPKVLGIDRVLRTMSPMTIAVDEITSAEDCEALLRAGWCGVSLLATAHAASVSDLRSRPVYGPIVKSRVFDMVVILHSDKSFRAERMET